MAINLRKDDLVYPYFVVGGRNRQEPINNFPGIFRFSVDRLIRDLIETEKLGVRKILLFGVPDRKDNKRTEAFKKNSIIASALKATKDTFPNLIIFTDVCLCAYTAHGHCGILKSHKSQVTGHKADIDNKETLAALAKIALLHAEAGADYVAPSAMAKGQVAAIRKALDKSGYRKTKIMGYSAKFASSFYGPFRNAADSAPKFGDRTGYQLDYKDAESAIEEIEADVKEGADIVMVKPALGYLDIISKAKEISSVPLAAYNVSGEYAFVKYGAKTGLWDEKKMVHEIMSSIKRSGADLIITYHAKDIARWLKT